MKYSSKLMLIATLVMFVAVSCDSGPKVISTPTDSTSEEGSTGIFSDDTETDASTSDPSQVSSDVHTVVVEEVLPASKYMYAYVKEGDAKYWVATSKKEIKVGETYFYQGGLLKTNFESKEHNRVFDKIFLISSLVDASHSQPGTPAADNASDAKVNRGASDTPRNIEKEGSVRISEIVANPQKYAGKTVQVSGECVKINPNIMERNWIHLKDGSKDEYDLVVTSDVMIPEGHVVTMTAKVTLDKDFGAGYRYEIILEDGVVVK